jgi:effector-binding domain-containing protein
VRAIAIRATVDHEDLGSWWRGGLAELRAAVPAGKLGGMFDGALFADGVGEAIVFTPVEKLPRLTGRLTQFDVPAAELALVTHRGSHADVDAAYGALGAYVATHEIAVDGAVREYYVADPLGEPASWVTEIAWPVFRSR